MSAKDEIVDAAIALVRSGYDGPFMGDEIAPLIRAVVALEREEMEPKFIPNGTPVLVRGHVAGRDAVYYTIDLGGQRRSLVVAHEHVVRDTAKRGPSKEKIDRFMASRMTQSEAQLDAQWKMLSPEEQTLVAHRIASTPIAPPEKAQTAWDYVAHTHASVDPMTNPKGGNASMFKESNADWTERMADVLVEEATAEDRQTQMIDPERLKSARDWLNEHSVEQQNGDLMVPVTARSVKALAVWKGAK